MDKSSVQEHTHTHWYHCSEQTNKHLPVIVDAPEARKDVSEAGVAVKLGLTLGAFYRALQPSTQKALTEGDRDGQ